MLRLDLAENLRMHLVGIFTLRKNHCYEGKNRTGAFLQAILMNMCLDYGGFLHYDIMSKIKGHLQ
jgi:hypothetical protein